MVVRGAGCRPRHVALGWCDQPAAQPSPAQPRHKKLFIVNRQQPPAEIFCPQLLRHLPVTDMSVDNQCRLNLRVLVLKQMDHLLIIITNMIPFPPSCVPCSLNILMSQRNRTNHDKASFRRPISASYYGFMATTVKTKDSRKQNRFLNIQCRLCPSPHSEASTSNMMGFIIITDFTVSVYVCVSVYLHTLNIYLIYDTLYLVQLSILSTCGEMLTSPRQREREVGLRRFLRTILLSVRGSGSGVWCGGGGSLSSVRCRPMRQTFVQI